MKDPWRIALAGAAVLLVLELFVWTIARVLLFIVKAISKPHPRDDTWKM